MLILATNARDSLLSLLYTLSLSATIGLVLGSLINALWLRLTVAWIGVAPITYIRAFRATLTANFVVVAFGVSLPLITRYLELLNRPEREYRIDVSYSPFVLFHFLVASVLGHAVIFSNALEDKDISGPLRFSKAAIVALVYLALCSMFAALTALLIALGFSAMVG